MHRKAGGFRAPEGWAPTLATPHSVERSPKKRPVPSPVRGVAMESFTTGTIAGDGTFRCEKCGAVGPLARSADVPACPECGSTQVSRTSLFGERLRQDAGGDDQRERELLVAAAVEHAPTPGTYLAFRDGDDVRVVTLDAEHVKIGRSLTADVRFDDPTVSRRHALLVRQDEGVRVVDDRSMNGVFVNGERVEWRVLRHGDELVVGRHRLMFVDTAVHAASGAAAASAGSA
ncbi:FHA domain-containing protein [Conexibacter sp. W3-3-2]|nr:FHA domain-containing protein [Conexibacter sp. W3-3-2]